MKLFAAASLMVATLFSGAADAASFRDYPAEIYRGEIHLPDFAGAQKEYADFRTRLGDAARRRKPSLPEAGLSRGSGAEPHAPLPKSLTTERAKLPIFRSAEKCTPT